MAAASAAPRPFVTAGAAGIPLEGRIGVRAAARPRRVALSPPRLHVRRLRDESGISPEWTFAAP
jgi:hypothetical protein